MRLKYAGLLLAGLLLLSVRTSPTATLGKFYFPPPSAEVWLAAALGNRNAAADLAWLATVQLVGQTRYAEAGYPYLEQWLDVTTSLAPTFDAPYSMASGFLAADVKRSRQVDRLLARGETAMPDSFVVPMARGFAAYFGQYDPLAAAAHFRTALKRHGAPAYLNAFAARLENTAASCRTMQRDLALFESQQLKGQPTPEARSIILACVGRALERAAGTFRLQYGREASIAELVEAGLTESPLAPAGECWSLGTGKAELTLCPSR